MCGHIYCARCGSICSTYVVSRVYHSFKGLRGMNGNEVSYGNSAFEMEAKSNEMIDGYLDVRIPFEFFRYYGKI